MDPDLKFDRLKFIFETNIDLLEIIQLNFKEVYVSALGMLKKQVCPDLLELLKENSSVVKRLYPKHQPDVYLRLQQSQDEKLKKKRMQLRLQDEQDWNDKIVTSPKSKASLKRLQSASSNQNINLNSKSKLTTFNEARQLKT